MISIGATQHAVAGDLAFALRASAKRLNRHVGWLVQIAGPEYQRKHQAMNLSPEVQEIMDAEIDRLLANPAYDLEPVRRLQVFQAVGPSAIPEQNARLVSQAVSLPKLTIADRIRARIAFLSARKVAAFWESACQETDRDNNNEPGREDTVDDHAQYLRQLQIVPIEELSVFQVPRPYIPHHILEMAEMALDGIVKHQEKFLTETNEWWGIYPRPERCPREYSIKWAAQEALYLAVLWPTYFSPQNHNYSTETDELDLYAENHTQAPCGYAMIAYAGVFEPDRLVDADRRRKFWLWWLAWAIPAAHRLENHVEQIK